MSIFITTMSVFVTDQQKALEFYTDVLGFTKKNDVPVGDHRWLTVVGATNDVELLRFRGNTFERMYDREGQTNNLKAAIADYQKALGFEPNHDLLPWEMERAKAKSGK